MADQEDGKSSELVPLGGLWLNETQDGRRKYMKGYLGEAQVLIFKNKFKAEDKHPDYRMYLAKGEPRKKAGGGDGDGEVPF